MGEQTQSQTRAYKQRRSERPNGYRLGYFFSVDQGGGIRDGWHVWQVRAAVCLLSLPLEREREKKKSAQRAKRTCPCVILSALPGIIPLGTRELDFWNAVCTRLPTSMVWRQWSVCSGN